MTTQKDEIIDSIAVCIVTNNHESETKYFIDNLIKNTSGNCTLYIYDYQSESEEFRTYLQEICVGKKAHFKHFSENIKLATIYNIMLADVTEKYVAILTINNIIGEDWTNELLYHYKNIINSGCIGIKSQQDDVKLTSLLFHNILKDEDEMKTIYIKDVNFIDTPVFFDHSRIKDVGMFDEMLGNFGYEMNDFSFRFLSNGYQNYYIKNTTCIKTYLENQFLLPHKTKDGLKELKMKINTIIKKQNSKSVVWKI
jgi:hypothetical protein